MFLLNESKCLLGKSYWPCKWSTLVQMSKEQWISLLWESHFYDAMTGCCLSLWWRVKYSQVTARVYIHIYIYVRLYVYVNGLHKRDEFATISRRFLTNCTFLMHLAALASDGGGAIFLSSCSPFTDCDPA